MLLGRREQILMRTEKTGNPVQCGGVRGAYAHMDRVGACFTRGKKCCVIDFSVPPRLGGKGGQLARGLKNRLLKKRRRKDTPPILIGNVVSIGLILRP